MSNSGKKITAAQLAARCASSPLFRLGYQDASKGKSFDYAIADNSAMYERGRFFAIYCKAIKAPKAIWRNDMLAKTAQERIVQSCYAGYMR